MTAWLARNGFPGISKNTVDRLMRDEAMNGLVRGWSCPHPAPHQCSSSSAVSV